MGLTSDVMGQRAALITEWVEHQVGFEAIELGKASGKLDRDGEDLGSPFLSERATTPDRLRPSH